MTDRMETTRRGALGAMTVGALVATGALPVAAQAARKTFVLVHGAWHGGWCWRRVSDLLEKKGHKVFTPTMTGLGACSHLISKDVNLTTHITDIKNFIKWEILSDIVLVGHSYAGIIISGVAEELHGKISSIVFLDAFMPENGDSLAEKAAPAFRDAIANAINRGDVSLKAPPAAAFGVAEADRAWVDGKCTPQPISTYTEKAVYTGGRDKVAKKTYIRAKGYASPAFDAALAKTKADASWKTHEMTSGHDAMVIQPQELTELLLQAV
ncbi:alpha/beta hydrolase family protein [Rhodoplanes sp. Z2-YC6860]|uniref:alpha/beta hydrolase family protein n=1 Tax=Rhodoplanes sp. Z2-YC6860 TaxID=674703 RepID=UPI00078E6F3F|nr:alpha/beta hydrolase family protein [Rhodoplanes sp. Z2-YC6860]AMN40378.1 esterase [Rhodoplanes sp. Z2-YC6860]